MTRRELTELLAAYPAEAAVTLEISSGWREALTGASYEESRDQGPRIILTSKRAAPPAAQGALIP